MATTLWPLGVTGQQAHQAFFRVRLPVPDNENSRPAKRSGVQAFQHKCLIVGGVFMKLTKYCRSLCSQIEHWTYRNRKRLSATFSKSMQIPVPEVGLEPTRDCSHWILNPARLPIPPLRHMVYLN